MYRSATAIDAHQFADDDTRELWLACLQWEGHPGLVGHSDGDVAAHAVCDAVLIAAGLGELGTIFGVDQPQWAGATGQAMMSHVVERVREAGWQIEFVSVQIIGQRPRLLPRKYEAEQRMSEILGAPVAVCATTTDRMGFTGRDEGLAAIATATLSRANMEAECK
ncbi:2-C-methyl-D-erythritol 2,4-cyclodiphosphate synthase [Trueperella sp. LYQ141]|uniref:2-C-methyl-D-erythritol 2,4-cyclodiphosphate synthase n=1 Tax=Trueperella sp. LYQ141 TaxID=3391058 RepID=UPI0039833484